MTRAIRSIIDKEIEFIEFPKEIRDWNQGIVKGEAGALNTVKAQLTDFERGN